MSYDPNSLDNQLNSLNLTGSQLPSFSTNSSSIGSTSTPNISFSTPLGFLQPSTTGSSTFYYSSAVYHPATTDSYMFYSSPEAFPYSAAPGGAPLLYYPPVYFMQPAIVNQPGYAGFGLGPPAGFPQPTVVTGSNSNPGNKVDGKNKKKNKVDRNHGNWSEEGRDGNYVSFMCNYGGHDTILSVKRDVSFNELKQKLKDAFGHPVDIKYQHPDVSSGKQLQVSSQSDFNDMMKVYEKSAKSSPDGWSKLNVFFNLPGSVDSGLSTSKDIKLPIIPNSELEDLKKLGSGTYGTVYHGRWSGADVAIKRMNDNPLHGKSLKSMEKDFLDEAKILAKLKHPNVLTFYGVVCDDLADSLAIVTEYMVDGSLRNALRRNGRGFDKHKRLSIAVDVACGMDYLHGKNIVHFDVKSPNLLLNLRDPQRPICKVGDFGLSKIKYGSLVSGGARGTISWMAPELLNGTRSRISNKVDIYSFGIVMWELLTAEEPYTGLDYHDIRAGVVAGTLRPTVPRSCDSGWRSLMERCWSSEPSKRPSFKEIANELRAMS